jgi:hypothetical protein
VVGYDRNNNSFIMDVDDYYKFNDMCWHADNKGYIVNSIRNRANIKMHRLVMSCPTGMCVDHINGDKYDNRKKNLRICTNTENARNHVPQKNKTISGISKTKYNKWMARIGFDGERIYLGTFDSEQKAIAARIKAENELYGSFSYIGRMVEKH